MTGTPRLLLATGRDDGDSLPGRPVTASSLSQHPAEVASMTQPKLRASQLGGRAVHGSVESRTNKDLQP